MKLVLAWVRSDNNTGIKGVKNQHNVNAYHNAELDGVFMFESYITDTERGILAPKGYEDTTDGSWFSMRWRC